MAANTSQLHIRIERLEAELAAYRESFLALINTRAELAGVLDGAPSREQLVIQVASLREALHWIAVVSDYKLADHRAHVAELLTLTKWVATENVA